MGTGGKSDQAVERILGVLSQRRVAIATFDSYGECRYASPFWYTLLGAKPSNVTDLARLLTDDPELRDAVRRGVKSVRNGENEPAINIPITNKDGVSGTYAVAFAQFKLRNETEVGVLLSDTSTSTSSDTSPDLEQIGRLATLGQITAGVAHEFNNILTSVLGWTQIAGQNAESPSAVSSALEIIEANAKRAKDIAARLLGVSRSSEEACESLSVVAILEEILQLLSWEIKNANIDIFRSFDQDETCFGSENQIGQVFINIIRNAMDAMPNGGALYIGVKRRSGVVEVAFTDTGPGMAPEMIDRIFDPFFTTKTSGDEHVHGGTGLGLAICRDALKRTGGSIRVESELGQGTRFIVSLPLSDTTSSGLPATGENGVRSIAGITVLVADDEPDIGEMIRTSLELRGADVVTVGTGQEALAACQANRFDAAFVDFSMPGLSGHALERELLGVQPELPIIVMSGCEVEMSEDAPIADFLKKPFDLDDVELKLLEVLRNARC